MPVEILYERRLNNGRRVVRIGGYGLLFGEDGDGDITDAKTVIDVTAPPHWVKAHGPQKRPILYEHGVEHNPLGLLGPLGIIDTEIRRPSGIWIEGNLDGAHPMFWTVYQDILANRLGWSNKSQVKAKRLDGGKRWIAHMTISEWTLTHQPVDWRQLPHIYSQPLKAGGATGSEKTGAGATLALKVYPGARPDPRLTFPEYYTRKD